MEAALLYLLKANVVLALFAAAYYGLLRRLTFFKLNRAFLLLALLFAAVYPALPMPGLLPAEAPAAPVVAWAPADFPTVTTAVAPLPSAAGPDWQALALWLYVGGAAVLLGRLLVQLLALARLRRASRPATTPTGVPYRQLPAPGDPFSFGRTIYLHAGQHSAAELAVVLAHEQAHVRQGHTLDVLLAHLGTAVFWLNPAAWLLRRALLDNLEYLADAATLRTGLDRRAYQYCLLQLSRGTAGPALALPFTFFTLKNRVAMMNTPISSRGQLARYFLAGPLVVLAALGYSAAHARSAEPVAAGTTSLANPIASAPSVVMAPANAQMVTASQPAAEAQKSAAPTLAPAVRTPLASTTKLPKTQLMTSLAATTKAAQSGPTPLYYLDGQAVTEAQFKALKPSDIAQIQIIKGEQARQMAGDKGSSGIVVITTEANKNTPAVLAFNQRVQRIAPLQKGTGSAAPNTAFPTDALYYLDGQPSTEAAITSLDPKSISTIDIVSGQRAIAARPAFNNTMAPSIVFVVTKANADSPAVQSLVDKADLASGYTHTPAAVNAIVPKALTYITSHYPDARLSGEVIELKQKTTGTVKYQVQLINGKRPFYVYFSPQGEFLGE